MLNSKRFRRRLVAAVFIYPSLLFGTIFPWTTGAFAQSPSGSGVANNHYDDLLLGGVVTNQTITTIGQEFYRSFLDVWREQPKSSQFSLAIYERPSARWGSLIWVEQNYQRLYQTFLYAGRANAKATAEAAAMLVYNRASELELQELLFKEPDLGKRDF